MQEGKTEIMRFCSETEPIFRDKLSVKAYRIGHYGDKHHLSFISSRFAHYIGTDGFICYSFMTAQLRDLERSQKRPRRWSHMKKEEEELIVSETVVNWVHEAQILVPSVTCLFVTPSPHDILQICHRPRNDGNMKHFFGTKLSPEKA